MSDSASAVVVNEWHLAPENPVGRAVVLPGGSGYTVDHPLLWWTCQVLAENGWRVVTVRWEIDDAARADAANFVARAAQQALDLAGDAERTLVVGKSFGTYAASWANERGWPGVWLTPVLTIPEIANALRDGQLPGLVVGGTADELWDADLARASGLSVLEIDDANHILYTAGDWKGSYDDLGRTLEAVEDLARGLVD
ncbi:alpha/beta hydrolase [Nocardioides immobilis]|uniref:Alpha/beta hydrolase n=1 Tax=Nocardioides immobilis TaxID=2049295 RepID=A0A417XYZ9_9ACTN|nr:alpha/beta hydrolase [Nocardioides immobilis]RHW25587.1 alpha/beta hydrolase [Nocardioides immobilis]